MSNSMLLVMVEILFFFVSYYVIRGQLIINECTLQSFSVNQNIYDLFGSPDSPSPNQNKLNFILTTVTVRIGWNLTCKQYDGFGVADLVPGSVFSNEKSPSLSNHSGSYQNHPPSCPHSQSYLGQTWDWAQASPKQAHSDFKLHRFLFVLNKWFSYIHYIGQPLLFFVQVTWSQFSLYRTTMQVEYGQL